MIYDAGTLARGWLSVATASSTDPDRPQLYRTVHLEQFAHGLRISATDSYMLLTTWISERDFDYDAEPGADELPDLTAIARDIHGRAANLLGHLLKLSAVEDSKPIDVAVRLGVPARGSGGGDALAFEGMDAQVVIIDHPDHERVQLDVYDGGYPHLRHILTTFRPVRTDGIALNPILVAKLAKAAKLHGTPLLWRWGGKDKAAGIEMGAEPTVTGIVMPSRWDFDTNSPWATPSGDTE